MRCLISNNRDLLWILLWKLSKFRWQLYSHNTALVSCVWAVGRLVWWGWGYKRPGCTVWGWLDTLASSGSAVVERCGLSTGSRPPPRHQWTHCVLAANTTLLLLTAARDTWLHVATRGHTWTLWTHGVRSVLLQRSVTSLGNELNNACIGDIFKSFKCEVIFTVYCYLY